MKTGTTTVLFTVGFLIIMIVAWVMWPAKARSTPAPTMLPTVRPTMRPTMAPATVKPATKPPATKPVVTKPVKPTKPHVTLYSECEFSGKSVYLEVGKYTTADLKARGVPSSLGSVKVQPGLDCILYGKDNFTGPSYNISSWFLTDVSCFDSMSTVKSRFFNGLNDRVLSVIVESRPKPVVTKPVKPVVTKPVKPVVKPVVTKPAGKPKCAKVAVQPCWQSVDPDACCKFRKNDPCAVDKDCRNGRFAPRCTRKARPDCARSPNPRECCMSEDQRRCGHGFGTYCSKKQWATQPPKPAPTKTPGTPPPIGGACESRQPCWTAADKTGCCLAKMRIGCKDSNCDGLKYVTKAPIAGACWTADHQPCRTAADKTGCCLAKKRIGCKDANCDGIKYVTKAPGTPPPIGGACGSQQPCWTASSPAVQQACCASKRMSNCADSSCPATSGMAKAPLAAGGNMLAPAPPPSGASWAGAPSAFNQAIQPSCRCPRNLNPVCYNGTQFPNQCVAECHSIFTAAAGPCRAAPAAVRAREEDLD